MKYCKCKEINTLIKKLVREGWKYYRGSKHGKLLDPTSRRRLTVPISPSDCRAYMNFKHDVQRVITFTEAKPCLARQF